MRALREFVRKLTCRPAKPPAMDGKSVWLAYAGSLRRAK